MKDRWFFVALMGVVYALASCGTAKNTKVRRAYHAVTANFNIYYNGKVAFDESLDAMQNNFTESYTDRILMYPISAQPKDKLYTGGPFDRAIEKGNKAIKIHSIQVKPDKKPGWRNDPRQVALQEQEEYNPFLKLCWLLVGQGQFYNADFLQASATFSYIARHYAHDGDMVAQARLWQARAYSEMAWPYEAEDILSKLNITGIPEKRLDMYAAVYADFLIKNGRLEDAIPYLITATKAEKNSRQKQRMKYLLGQLYAGLGLDDMAYKAFGDVARSNPPYDLEFAARIRQTEVYHDEGGNKIVAMLRSMARSEKNKDYLDQVYYALGNIYMARRDTATAIDSYETGAALSVRNGMDKAILLVRLGDIYFQKRDYIKAQPCFSGAVGIIKREYEDYERISKQSAALDELVIHAQAIHLQDSLQTLARLPEAERLAVIDNIIEQLVREEEEARKQADKEAYLSEAEAQGTGIDRPGTAINVPTIPLAPGESSFYFYNTQMVAQGKTQFQRRWGRRLLEDDWRRKSKRAAAATGGSVGAGGEAGALAGDSIAGGEAGELPDSLADDPKKREYYLQQIPFTQEEKDASDIIIVDGLYNMAMIYKDKLEDLRLSVDGFEELERRFPDNEHLMESYYQVYLLSLRMRDGELTEKYKAKMAASFPGSDYAIAIADPDYESSIRSMDSVQSAIYEATYESYLAGDTSAVRLGYEAVSLRYPLASLLPKFMFLNALTYVQKGDVEGFKESLRALVEKYPKADVSSLAGEMLKGILRGRELVQGGVRGMVWNLRFGLDDDGSLTAADSARTFTAGKNQPGRLVMMYPKEAIDKNRLLFTVAAYNFARFMVKEFDMVMGESGALGTLTVSGFINFDELLQYYGMIYGKDGYAAALSAEIAVIPITDANYETLMRGKTLDEYIVFLEENFSEEAPGLVARLRSRLDASPDEDDLLPEGDPSVDLPQPTYPQPDTPAEDAAVVATAALDSVSPVVLDSIPPVTLDSIPPVALDTITTPQPTIRPETPAKTPAQIRKEKEREYKARQKQKATERKEKERAYKQKVNEREKARREARKARRKGK